MAVPIFLERAQLAHPIHHSIAHRSPLVLPIRLAFHILAVAMADAVLRQQIVSIGIRRVIRKSGCVAGVPVEHEMGRLHRIQNLGSFGPGGGIETGIIFQKQDNAFLARFGGGIQQLLVNGCAIRSLILQSPKIETAYAIGLECLGQFNAALQDFVLLVARMGTAQPPKAYSAKDESGKVLENG